jgi:RND superfamily putative drug exporter
VILGLGMLYFSTFAKIQYSGPAIALSLAVALAAALTLAPVLLHWLRGAVFWPFKPPHHTKGADPEAESQAEMPMHAFWAKVADLVVRRPGLIFAASLLALAPFAVVGLRARPNYGQLSDLSPSQPSIVGTRIISKYFPIGELGKTTVLVAHPTLDFLTPEGREAVEALSKKLAALPDVAEVRSVSRPLGRPAKSPVGQFGQRAFRDLIINAQVNARYVSTRAEGADHDHITRLDVAFRTDPYSEESLGTLAAVEAAVREAVAPGGPLAGASTTGLAGTTVLIDDLKRVTTADEQRMYVLVTLGVYAILVALLRRPGICLYLIATVVLGYLASLGMTELLFRALHRGPEPWFGLDWKVGFFLFVILVAVGEDYNIFLMARVVEEESRLGTVEGTRRAILHTGGIISSCGLIMACTFGSMLMGSLTSLRELGFALGLGVLLDTFVVRPVLVPAFVVLLCRLRAGGRRATRPQPEATATST